MAQSVKVNYILNLINTGTQMLFPLITFPYVCRVIEADGVGQINFSSLSSAISPCLLAWAYRCMPFER